MSRTTVSRRSVAKGAAWSVPAVALASGAPALAASNPPVECPQITTTSCWNCDGANYTFAVIPFDEPTSSVSIQTSSLITWAPTTQAFKIVYVVDLPAGATFSGPVLNGGWGAAGTWTGPTIVGNTIEIDVIPDGSNGSLCGGIQFDITGLSGGPASLTPSIQYAPLPGQCPAGVARQFVYDPATNISSYGAAGGCQGGARWN